MPGKGSSPNKINSREHDQIHKSLLTFKIRNGDDLNFSMSSHLIGLSLPKTTLQTNNHHQT